MLHISNSEYHYITGITAARRRWTGKRHIAAWEDKFTNINGGLQI